MKLSQIHDGDVYSFERVLSPQDVRAFAELTGDFNPLHCDPETGRRSQFGGNIVHGMLAAGLFSQLVGMFCPGQSALYLAQTLSFKQPVFPGDALLVRGTVISKSESTGVVTLKTEILKAKQVVVTGEAKALVREDS